MARIIDVNETFSYDQENDFLVKTKAKAVVSRLTWRHSLCPWGAWKPERWFRGLHHWLWRVYTSSLFWSKYFLMRPAFLHFSTHHKRNLGLHLLMKQHVALVDCELSPCTSCVDFVRCAAGIGSSVPSPTS